MEFLSLFLAYLFFVLLIVNLPAFLLFFTEQSVYVLQIEKRDKSTELNSVPFLFRSRALCINFLFFLFAPEKEIKKTMLGNLFYLLAQR